LHSCLVANAHSLNTSIPGRVRIQEFATAEVDTYSLAGA
jgi:hypothetical protein